MLLTATVVTRLESVDADTLETLSTLTGDRSALMKKLREDLWTRAPDLSAADRQAVWSTANMFEHARLAAQSLCGQPRPLSLPSEFSHHRSAGSSGVVAYGTKHEHTIRMDLRRKLSILADAAKYDASCASSGTTRAIPCPGAASARRKG